MEVDTDGTRGGGVEEIIIGMLWDGRCVLSLSITT